MGRTWHIYYNQIADDDTIEYFDIEELIIALKELIKKRERELEVEED